MAEEDPKVVPAAYLPFKTFISSIDALQQGIPRKLDRTIWRQAGIVQGQIMMAFRFFKLINESDEPTPALHQLVNHPSTRPQQIAALVQQAYSDVLAHDLTKMTPKMLDEAMSKYNVQGDTKRKAMAFFIRAAKYAEMPMLPLLAAQTRNSNGVRRKRKPIVVEPVPVGPRSQSAGNTIIKTVLLPSGAKISLHIDAQWLDLSPAERDYVFGLVDFLQNHPSLIGDGGDEEEADE